MEHQIAVQQLLSRKLVEIRLKNPSYSLRAFAKKLQISSAALSEIMNGKRRVSAKMASRFAARLTLNPEESEKILAAFRRQEEGPKRPRPPQAPIRDSVQLSMDHFKVISDWYHFGILSLSETEDFRSAPEWIAHRLGIRLVEAKEALARLERLEMLERDPKGRLKATGVQYTTTDEIANLSLIKSHGQNLELARQSLEQDPLHERDFTAMTMAIDPDLLPEAKKRIRQFRAELCAFLESGKKKEVYKMCMQLMPLSRGTRNPKK